MTGVRHALTGRYVAGRVGQAVVVLLGAWTAAFLLLQAQPGDAVMIRFENPELGLSPEQIATIREAYGVDQPLLVQYVDSLLGVLRGDLGYSVQSGALVADLVGDALPPTLLLAASGLALAVVLAVALVAASTLTRLSWLRGALRSLPGLFVAVPVFWLGIVLVQVFSFRLGWVSVIRPGPVEGLVLPVLTVAVPLSAPIAQVLARAVDEVATRPFVAVEVAKGAPWRRVVVRTVGRNAVVPALTLAGLTFGELVGGAVVTEAVYGRAGIGTLTQQALAAQDLPVLQAIVLMSAAAFVVLNLAVDLVVPLVDPRLGTDVSASGASGARRRRTVRRHRPAPPSVVKEVLA